MLGSVALPITWLTLVLLAIFVEAVFENLVAVWFAPSSAAAFTASLFSVSVGGQLMVFAAVSLVLLIISRVIITFYQSSQKHNRKKEDIE